MNLQEKVARVLSEQIGEAHAGIGGVATDIANWCLRADEGETRRFDLDGWLLTARKESVLSMILAPATTVASTAIVQPGTQVKMLSVGLD